MKIHIFGEYKQWAISEDDGCLRFHPQYNTNPEKKSSWIWKEAFEEIERLGGFKKVIDMLRYVDEPVVSDCTSIMRIIEEVQNRAFAKGLPNKILTSTEFVNYIRGLFPEYYVTLRSLAEGK
jgi:hypothetical protein